MGRIRQSAVVVTVGLIVGLAVGGSLAVLFIPAPVPASVASDQPLDTVRPSVMDFSDPHEVHVALTIDSLSGVRSPRGGLLTALACVPGQEVVAGTRIFGVDGAAVVGLATSVPLWRQISVGDEGADVAALENELARLAGDGEGGSGLEIDGTWEWNDALAFDALLAGAGVTTTDEGEVPLSAIAWLPAPVMSVAGCPVGVGASVASGTVVAQFAARITLARFTPAADAVDGPRALALENALIPVDESGVLTDPAALALLAESPEFAALDPSATPPSISASWVLTSSVLVTVVPPSAVHGISGSRGCVTDAEGATRVTVIASQLGRTLVAPERPLGDVIVHPTGAAPCR